MGTLFSKKKESRITEQDHAILGLKKQRDQLKQYQKRINRDLEKEKELAKRLLKEGKKDRAKLLLRKKKFQEGLLDKTDAQLDQLERLVHDIEFATVQSQVIDGLKKGNEALERANSIFSIEEIEDIMADTQEAVEKQNEINSLLSGQLTEEDENEVIEELDKLLMTDLEPSIIADLPSVPKDKIEDNIGDQLPDVPNTEPKSKSKTKTPVAELAN